jgi:hypothetical protein
MVSGRHSDLVYDLLAPPLILATPFASFVNHNEYSYVAAEILISLTGLVAAGLLCALIMMLSRRWLRVIVTAGLLTLFVDLQFDWLEHQRYLGGLWFGLLLLLLCWLLREHLSRITAAVFATMFAASLLFPSGSDEWSVKAQNRRADAQTTSRPAPPVLVHLIFDEFIGIEGIPSEFPDGTAVRHLLRSLLHTSGFRVFGRAYSRFQRTDDSISNMLNYASVPEERHFIEGSHKRLRKNKYFTDMYQKGYFIHVYQPNYIDFCTGYESQIASCRTFLSAGIKPLETLRLPPSEKAELIIRNFIHISVTSRNLSSYYRQASHEAVNIGYYLPQWWNGSPDVWSTSGIQVLDTLARDVVNAAPGDLFFAHILLPHAPYVYDRDCDLRDPHDWEDHSPRVKSRAHYYKLYLEQVECIRKRLQTIFALWRREGVYDHTKLIIHGDHGSRLYLKEPTVPNKDELRPSDYVDSFSTLFAVKAPGVEPEYDRRIVAIQDSLAAIAHDQPLDQAPARAMKPYVLLRDMRGAEMMPRPMPEFGSTGAE